MVNTTKRRKTNKIVCRKRKSSNFVC